MSAVILPPVFGWRSKRRVQYECPFFMRETIKPIGGVGMTVRWAFEGVVHTDSAPICVFFTHIDDVDAFRRVAEEIPTEVAARDSEYEVDAEFGECTSFIVNDSQNVVAVVSFFAERCKFRYEIDDDGERQCTYELGIERFDRSSWNFWNQTEDTAAPKQSWHKWDFSWIPSTWTTLPFTWRRLASNLDAVDVDTLPKPLIYHVCRYRELKLRAEMAAAVDGGSRLQHARLRAYRRRIPARAHVTASLGENQSRELLHAMWTRRYKADEASLRDSREVLESYILYGYTSRLFGPYRQEARFVGMGRKPRMFKRLPQYDPRSLSLGVLNTLYQADGSLVGKDSRTSRKRGSNPAPRVMDNDKAYAKRLCAAPRFFLANT